MGMEHDALRQDAGEPGRDLEMLMNNDEICPSPSSDPRRMVRKQRSMAREYRRELCRLESLEEIVHVVGQDTGRAPIAARGDKVMNA